MILQVYSSFHTRTFITNDIHSFQGTHCNYQVTYNDRAWNEYIKKGLDYVEMGNFKSITAYHIKQWPIVSSTSENTTSNINQILILTEKQKSAEQRRQFEKEIAEQAFELAQTDIQSAMALMQKMMPTQFLAHSNWSVFKLFCE